MTSDSVSSEFSPRDFDRLWGFIQSKEFEITEIDRNRYSIYRRFC